MAAHYSVGILPARPKRPRDKAAVEAGVRFAQSYILGRLRNVTFFSLAACNTAIAVAVERMNSREMRRLGVGGRRQLFEDDRTASHAGAAAGRLPEYAEWHLALASASTITSRSRASYTRCHTTWIREQVNTRATTRTIEIFHRALSKRVAAHARRYGGRRHGHLPELHTPSAHRRYAEWTPERPATSGPGDWSEHRGVELSR